MTLGPHVPEWAALRERLDELRSATGAFNAYVIDAWGNLWCSARSVDWGAQSTAIEQTQVELSRLDKPLARGGRIEGPRKNRHGRGYFRSFASVYVLLLRFSGDFDAVTVRRTVNEALSRIEALVLALPPPDGPWNGGAEGFGVA